MRCVRPAMKVTGLQHPTRLVSTRTEGASNRGRGNRESFGPSLETSEAVPQGPQIPSKHGRFNGGRTVHWYHTTPYSRAIADFSL